LAQASRCEAPVCCRMTDQVEMRGGVSLRKTLAKTWVVIGGLDAGIIVRQGSGLNTPKAADRLSYGSLLQEVEILGDRLRYRKIVGSGPAEGWISVKLKDKQLAVPCLPRESTELVGDPAMVFYAISDIHVEKRGNMEWLRSLPRFERSTLIVAGDVGVKLTQVREALTLFIEKFDHVFYCYGNHECWCQKPSADARAEQHEDSYEKLIALRALCDELGVVTTPTLVEGVWVVPVLGWYHDSWDTEPELQSPPGKNLTCEVPLGKRLATDSMLCNWGELENGGEELARHLDGQNEQWGVWPLPEDLTLELSLPREERRHFVLSFSHFLPRMELLPEKRFLFMPNLSQIVGSNFIKQRVQSLSPNVHVFGHTHFPWDMTLDDGVRYRSWPLGSPDEQARRIASYPSEHVEQWHPLPVFDSNGRHYPTSEACWFSEMYTRIKRDPSSHYMADYVAAKFCPDAPRVPTSILSPVCCLTATCEEEVRRREKYTDRSMTSMHRQTGVEARASQA